MQFFVIATVALLASALTLFSGFGLGTLLMPVFALFFPVPVAIAATAIVHLANNVFKLALVGRQADWGVVARFAVPAALAAFAGAGVLVLLSGLPELARYDLLGRTHTIEAVKLAVGTLIAVFAVLELSPSFAALTFPPRYLALGGLLSGFIGGLSGNQGALRSAFLIKAGLGKEAFIATGVVAAVIVDCARLAIYGVTFLASSRDVLAGGAASFVAVAMLAAFAGSFMGARLVAKVTLRSIQLTVAAMMLLIGIGLAAGII